MDLDAVVLAGPLSQVKIAGLTAQERAVRVARRVGASRILIAEPAGGGSVGELTTWRRGRAAPLLIIRADQLVHTPLVAPLVQAFDHPSELAIAVGPDDAYAGALLATGAAADRVLAALVRGETDTAIAVGATLRVPHGEIARHPIATTDDRRGAHRLLYRILIKPQDNAITRYLYRPVSFPLTRLLAWTPITPNQISYVVALLVLLGCWMTAHASMQWAIAGTAVVLVASYIDCCDGEIARLKLLSSRLGAWLDTIVDELSSVGYMVALGWHCHLAFGRDYLGELGFDPWLWAIGASIATYGVTLYCIYYNIIVAVGSANSQDYTSRFDVVPGAQPNSVTLRPAVAVPREPGRERPRWVTWIATYAPYIVRRDFISWMSLVLAALHWTHLSFAGFALGGAVTVVTVAIDHVKLRRLRRAIRRNGQILEGP